MCCCVFLTKSRKYKVPGSRRWRTALCKLWKGHLPCLRVGEQDECTRTNAHIDSPHTHRHTHTHTHTQAHTHTGTHTCTHTHAYTHTHARTQHRTSPKPWPVIQGWLRLPGEDSLGNIMQFVMVSIRSPSRCWPQSTPES